MAFIVAFVLGLLALAFVLYPLVRHDRRSALSEKKAYLSVKQGEEPTELEVREQIARSAIREVELDYQLGNIAETDYRSLRERYMHRALVALKLRYEHEEDEVDKEIEEHLRVLKEKYE